MSLTTFPILSWLSRHQILVGIVVTALLYGLFIANLDTHPAGSYVDESCIAYNGYLIAQTGVAENGVRYPLFIQCYTQGYTQWMSPGSVYLYAGLYSIVAPSVLSARIFAATIIFIAALLLGLLGARISGHRWIGIAVALLALTTPWLFEIGRLVHETFALAFAITLFVFLVHRAYSKDRWGIVDNIAIGLSLAFITYAYATGRPLGPLFGLGLLIFARSWRIFFGIVRTGVIYTLTLIPLFYVYLTEPLRISGRFAQATNLSADKTVFQNALTVVTAFITDLSPGFYIISGDVLHRHHIPWMGELQIGTYLLGLLGIGVILARYRTNRWWLFVIFGMLASLIPGAVTYERHHALRGIGFPIFFLLLTVPAIAWLAGVHFERQPTADEPSGTGKPSGEKSRPATWKLVMLTLLFAATAVQTVVFHIKFYELGDKRGGSFNDAYERVLDRALAEGSTPIYLDDGSDPAYIHALWYSTIKGIDKSIFRHLLDNQYAPPGGLVISSDSPCPECDIIVRDGSFVLFRERRNQPTPTMPVEAGSTLGNAPGLFKRPYGVAVESDGKRLVADTGNSRIQRIETSGAFLSMLGSPGNDRGRLRQPHGIAVNTKGDVFVTDAYRHVLIQLDPGGSFVNEWTGPEVPFYGPRDLAISSDNRIFIVDQGRSRIVIFDPASGQFSSWGSQGSGEGQFDGLTGIALGGSFVFVADAGNNRVQVFDKNGGFVNQWAVPQWQGDVQPFPDLAFDGETGRVFVSCGKTDEIFVFDPQGLPLSTIASTPAKRLNNPSSLVIKGSKLIVLNTGGDIPGIGNPSIVEFDLHEADKKNK